MAEQSGGEKTLPASPRKIQRAREKGNVAKSQDLSAAVMLLAAFLALWGLGPPAFRGLMGIGRFYFAEAHLLLLNDPDMQLLLLHAVMRSGLVVLPFMGVLVLAGLMINVAQFGILFSSEALTPKFEKLNPILGFQRFVSLRTLVELIKSLMKLTLIASITWLSLRGRWEDILSLTHMSPWDGSAAAWGLVLMLWWRVALVMLVIGLFDFAFQRWQHGRDLMMTQQEARQELKELEGDPKIRQRVRQIQRQMAMQRMMADVPEADVVVTNPTTYAVALRYDVGDMAAPIVAAKGARLVAERIRDIAVEHDVPIVERPDLAKTLYRTVEVGQAVSEDLFRAVAEVMAYVYQIDRREEKVRARGEAELAGSAVG